MSDAFTERLQWEEPGQSVGFGCVVQDRQTFDRKSQLHARHSIRDFSDPPPHLIVSLQGRAARQLCEYDKISLVHGWNESTRDCTEKGSRQEKQSEVNGQRQTAEPEQSPNNFSVSVDPGIEGPIKQSKEPAQQGVNHPSQRIFFDVTGLNQD